MNQLFQHLYMPANLAVEFMATFSRMEYALKSTGYALDNDSKVVPDWDRFANEIDQQFNQLSDKDLINSRDVLFTSPPRKQILLDQQVVFQVQTVDKNQRTTQQLIRFVRIVRNNLFHGGKFLPANEIETGRNEALVNASLIIIKTSIELNENVKQKYAH